MFVYLLKIMYKNIFFNINIKKKFYQKIFDNGILKVFVNLDVEVIFVVGFKIDLVIIFIGINVEWILL